MPWGISAWYDAQRVLACRQFRVVVDVGANVGQTAQSLVRFFPDASIYCFEPTQEPFRELKSRARHWPNVTLCNVALGDTTGNSRIYTGKGDKSELNTFCESHREGLTGSEEVEVITLDDFSESQDIREIDLLKMDVQGFELRVLSGARCLLESRRIKVIVTEVSFNEEYADMVPFAEIHSALCHSDYKLCGLYDLFRWGNKREVHFCNALYAQTELVAL